MVRRLVASCLFGLLVSTVARAAVHVDGDTVAYGTLEEALAAAPEGATVRLDEGDYAWPPITIARDVTLVGHGAVVSGGLPNMAQFVVEEAAFALEGVAFEDFAGRVLHAQEGSSVVLRGIGLQSDMMTGPVLLQTTMAIDVQIEDISLNGFNVSGGKFGSLIYGSASNMIIKNLIVEESVGVLDSVVQVTNTNLTISNTRFENLNATALAVGGDATVQVSDCVFSSLQSDQGAAITAQGGQLTVEQSVFTDNVALTGAGGAIWASGVDLTVSDSHFEGQIALLDGAAMYATDSDVVLTDNHLYSNQVVRHGGAVYVDGLSTVSSQRNLYCGNVDSGALGLAGALGVSGNTPLQSLNDRFVDNESGGGGAVYVGGTADALIAHATAVRNQGLRSDFVASGGEAHVSVRLSVFTQHEGFLAAPLDPTSSIGFDRIMFFGSPGLGEATLGAFVDVRDPLLRSTPIRDCEGMDLRPRWESAAVDPAFNVAERPDLDSSVADLGYHGGPEADPELWRDDDADGDPWWSDCDPDDGELGHGVDERCDGDDDDCDGLVDEDDPSLVPAHWWYTDADEDGFGDVATAPLPSCDVWSGWASVGGDCADDDPTRNPAEPERCDAIDRNCDGSLTEGAVDASVAFVDADRDGYGDASLSLDLCELSDGFSAQSGDCDDGLASTYPGAPEWCDFVDSDCDGESFDAEALDVLSWYLDADGDGFGSADLLVMACEAPARAVLDNNDCDDTDETRHPGAREHLGDGVDQDCDGRDARLVVPAACDVVGAPTAAMGLWSLALVALFRRTCG